MKALSREKLARLDLADARQALRAADVLLQEGLADRAAHEAYSALWYAARAALYLSIETLETRRGTPPVRPAPGDLDAPKHVTPEQVVAFLERTRTYVADVAAAAVQSNQKPH